MLKNSNVPLISAQELEALITCPQENGVEGIDTYFPLKIWFISLFCGVSGAGLLLKSHELASLLAKDDAMVEWLTRFLYFRGWFVCMMVAVGAYVYIKDKYIPLYSLVLLIISIVNFLFDMVVIFPERFGNPTVIFTVSLLFRLIVCRVRDFHPTKKQQEYLIILRDLRLV